MLATGCWGGDAGTRLDRKDEHPRWVEKHEPLAEDVAKQHASIASGLLRCTPAPCSCDETHDCRYNAALCRRQAGAVCLVFKNKKDQVPNMDGPRKLHTEL